MYVELCVDGHCGQQVFQPPCVLLYGGIFNVVIFEFVFVMGFAFCAHGTCPMGQVVISPLLFFQWGTYRRLKHSCTHCLHSFNVENSLYVCSDQFDRNMGHVLEFYYSFSSTIRYVLLKMGESEFCGTIKLYYFTFCM